MNNLNLLKEKGKVHIGHDGINEPHLLFYVDSKTYHPLHNFFSSYDSFWLICKLFNVNGCSKCEKYYENDENTPNQSNGCGYYHGSLCKHDSCSFLNLERLLNYIFFNETDLNLNNIINNDINNNHLFINKYQYFLYPSMTLGLDINICTDILAKYRGIDGIVVGVVDGNDEICYMGRILDVECYSFVIDHYSILKDGNEDLNEIDTMKLPSIENLIEYYRVDSNLSSNQTNQIMKNIQIRSCYDLWGQIKNPYMFPTINDDEVSQKSMLSFYSDWNCLQDISLSLFTKPPLLSNSIMQISNNNDLGISLNLSGIQNELNLLKLIYENIENDNYDINIDENELKDEINNSTLLSFITSTNNNINLENDELDSNLLFRSDCDFLDRLWSLLIYYSKNPLVDCYTILNDILIMISENLFVPLVNDNDNISSFANYIYDAIKIIQKDRYMMTTSLNDNTNDMNLKDWKEKFNDFFINTNEQNMIKKNIFFEIGLRKILKDLYWWIENTIDISLNSYDEFNYSNKEEGFEVLNKIINCLEMIMLLQSYEIDQRKIQDFSRTLFSNYSNENHFYDYYIGLQCNESIQNRINPTSCIYWDVKLNLKTNHAIDNETTFRMCPSLLMLPSNYKKNNTNEETNVPYHPSLFSFFENKLSNLNKKDVSIILNSLFGTTDLSFLVSQKLNQNSNDVDNSSQFSLFLTKKKRLPL